MVPSIALNGGLLGPRFPRPVDGDQGALSVARRFRFRTVGKTVEQLDHRLGVFRFLFGLRDSVTAGSDGHSSAQNMDVGQGLKICKEDRGDIAIWPSGIEGHAFFIRCGVAKNR